MKIKGREWRCTGGCNSYFSVDVADPENCEECDREMCEECLEAYETSGTDMFVCQYCLKTLNRINGVLDLLDAG